MTTGFTYEKALGLRKVLQEGVIQASERCQYQTAKWLAELSSSLSVHLQSHDPESQPDSQSSQDNDDIPEGKLLQDRLEKRELHDYLLAKSYFDCREFERCSAVFLPLPSPQEIFAGNPYLSDQDGFSPSVSKTHAHKKSNAPRKTNHIAAAVKLSQKSLFLALYAKFLTGEKKRQESTEMLMGSADDGRAINTELTSIVDLIEAYFTTHGTDAWSGGWLEYLYGVVLARRKATEQARQWLVRSIKQYAYNWGAWQELAKLTDSTSELERLKPHLATNIMTIIFLVHVQQSLFQHNEGVLRHMRDLDVIFPNNLFLKTEKALFHYHTKDYETGEAIFTNLMVQAPHRLDGLDQFSNILYVTKGTAKLAFLAQVALATDKFRPETCVIVGNYYASKSEHEKAVSFFRRALTLDSSFQGAWTLMGHEFVEMKNTHAAIESYRRAVDINSKDYRAWYGLGITYDMLEMYLYTLYYYERAASLRPFDEQVWGAMASCLEKLNKPADAIKVYKRALAISLTSGANASISFTGSGSGYGNPVVVSETLFAIASLYESLGDVQSAASYMEMTLAQEGLVESGGSAEDSFQLGNEEESERVPGTGVTNLTSKARMWLAKYEFEKGEYARAMTLAQELAHDGVEVEECRGLIEQIKGITGER